MSDNSIVGIVMITIIILIIILMYTSIGIIELRLVSKW